MHIKPSEKKWRAGFTGTSLNPAKWQTVQTGAGQTITVVNGELQITTGTTINAETIIRSIDTFTIPFRTMMQIKLSQRIANQEFYFEMVSVNPTTLLPDGDSVCGWQFDGVTATQAKYVVNGGDQPAVVSAASTVSTTASPGSIFEMEPTNDDCWFFTRVVDSTASRANNYVRNTQIPDPNALYKLQIRVKNLGTAPASSTTFSSQFVSVSDYSEITAEITSSRGSNNAAQAMSVNVTTVPTTNTSTEGKAAHDAAVSGNPMLMGAYAHATGQTAISADGDVVRLWADRQGRLAMWSPPVGTHANGWNNIAVSANGTSTAFDTIYTKTISVFGNASGATNLIVQLSQDNTNFYDSDKTITISGAGNFGTTFETGARYIRLKSSAAATITATIAGVA
jgi:hypothetical protein